MSKSVLITGGTGFLGCHLARTLLREKYEVILFDIAPLEAKDLLGKVTEVRGDILDAQKILDNLKGISFVVHAAAALPIQRDKRTIYKVNIEGTKTVLEGCLKQKVKRLVFISSTAVYGVPKHLPESEDAPLDPIGYYGQSKVAAENLCLDYEKKGLQINIIRPKTFLGPERLGVFQLWFEAIYTGKPIFLLGKGENKYQLLSVVDVSQAVIKALESKTNGEIFNIGAEEFGTWRSDLGYVINYAGSKTKIISLPVAPSQLLLKLLEILNLSPIAEWHYKTLPVNSYVSTEKARKLLGWKATKSNSQLLLESYQWYEKHRDEIIGRKGLTHRVGWNFGALNIVSRLVS